MSSREDEPNTQESSVDKIISDLIAQNGPRKLDLSTPAVRELFPSLSGIDENDATEPESRRLATKSAPVPSAEAGAAVNSPAAPAPGGQTLVERLLSGDTAAEKLRKVLGGRTESLWTGFSDPSLAERYEVKEQMSSGRTSQVYSVLDAQTNNLLAVKVMRGEWAKNPRLKERFIERATHARRLNHPNIVAHKMDCSANKTPCVLMELIDGKELADILAKHPLPKQIFFETFMQVCNALSHAHARGVIHGCINPTKILLSKAGRNTVWVRVVDFGMQPKSECFNVANNTDLDMDRQSCIYLSPEHHDENPIDARSDIFSLGCIMYEAVCGRPAFFGNSLGQLTSAKKITRPRELVDLANGNCPPRLDLVIYKCLEKDPDDRYQSIWTLREDLKLVAEGQDPHLSSKKLDRPKPIEIKGIKADRKSRVTDKLTCVVEGQLDVRTTVKSVLELVLETAYPGYSLLRLDSNQPLFSGIIIIKGGYQVISAKILDSTTYGYQALRQLFRIAAGEYQYLTVTADDVNIPESNLCLNLHTVLTHCPDLPATQTNLMAFSSAVDLIFDLCSGLESDVDGSWIEETVEGRQTNTGAQPVQAAQLTDLIKQPDESSWVNVKEGDINSNFKKDRDLEQLITSRHKLRHFDEQKAYKKERGKVAMMGIVLTVLLILFIVVLVLRSMH